MNELISEGIAHPSISTKAWFLKARLAYSWIKSNLSGRFISEYKTGSLLKCLHCNVENRTNGRSSFSLKLMQVAGSAIKQSRLSLILD